MRRALAILLSILGAGLGHAAMGYPRKGVGWFASSLFLYGAFVGSIVAGAPGLLWFSIGLLVCLRLAAILDTARIASPAVAPRYWTTTLIVVGMFIASNLAGLVGIQFARGYKMPIPSMYPSLEVGDHFLSSRIVGKLQRGQVIVFGFPPDPTKAFVQRLVGLPGDTIEIRHGELILNGRPVDKHPLGDSCWTTECTIWQETIDGNTHKIAVNENHPGLPPNREFGPITVPDGQLFVLGDNRDDSLDSRYWGYLPIELVEARPMFIYWSSEDEAVRWHRITKIVN